LTVAPTGRWFPPVGCKTADAAMKLTTIPSLSSS
jgi:hypothetical protein